MTTELNKLQKDEISKKVRKMSGVQLLAELEDTVQFDLLKASTEEFIKSDNAKAFWIIKNELLRRLHKLEDAK